VKWSNATIIVRWREYIYILSYNICIHLPDTNVVETGLQVGWRCQQCLLFRGR